jgi:POT family proton-dependent oligopeptide transporter
MKQPKALYLLNFVSMWECFSYYGMRALLVLYMVHELQFSDGEAFGLYALYTTLVEFGGILGGAVADRLLGLRRSILLGGITIALGHACMALPGTSLPFFVGLGLIIAGTSLFRSNAAAFLGAFYDQNDPRREAGYTLYYTFINIGGFLASLCCGFVGEVYGWHAGFGLAAIGMTAGNIAMLCGGTYFEGRGKAPNEQRQLNLMGVFGLSVLAPVSALALYYYAFFLQFLPLFALAGIVYVCVKIQGCSIEVKNRMKQLGVYIFLLVLFYACEEQLGSTLMLFIERHVDREVAFGLLPVTAFVTFNPMTILIAGPLLSPFLRKTALSGLYKIGLSFILLGIAFGILGIGCLQAGLEGTIPVSYAIFCIVATALGEILIGPTVFAAAAEAAPMELRGLTMGLVTLGFSLANLFSGYLSQMMAVEDVVGSLSIYTNGFAFIAVSGMAIGGILTYFRNRLFSKLALI